MVNHLILLFYRNRYSHPSTSSSSSQTQCQDNSQQDLYDDKYGPKSTHTNNKSGIESKIALLKQVNPQSLKFQVITKYYIYIYKYLIFDIYIYVCVEYIGIN